MGQTEKIRRCPLHVGQNPDDLEGRPNVCEGPRSDIGLRPPVCGFQTNLLVKDAGRIAMPATAG
jgi:hypothetical protein